MYSDSDFDTLLPYRLQLVWKPRFLYSAEYYVLRDEGAILHGTASETVIDKLEFSCGWMLDKTKGIDHAETAKFHLKRFYIFYEKNPNN